MRMQATKYKHQAFEIICRISEIDAVVEIVACGRINGAGSKWNSRDLGG
jgi:TATA-box binding protein (TBP) (component of TFIID and TFIIIB)